LGGKALWGAKLFRQGPCEKRDELFDRDEELKRTVEALKNNIWVAILGMRMSGKTSLAKVAANVLKKEGFSHIYVDLRGANKVSDMSRRIVESIPKSFLDRMGDYLEKIKVWEVEISLRKVSRTRTMEELLTELSRKGKLLVILDEVQEVRGGINHLLLMLARLRNSARNLSFLFTGSSIGLMDTLLNPSRKNPMYGRSPIEIELGPWPEKTAFQFLKEGLEKCSVKHSDDEIEEAVKVLGTLPGWLSFYGIRRCLGKSHEDSLRDSESEAVDIALEELRNAIKERGEWTRIVLRTIAAYGARWSDFDVDVSDSTLSDFLKMLKKLYIISEESGTYIIPDPIYRRAALRL